MISCKEIKSKNYLSSPQIQSPKHIFNLSQSVSVSACPVDQEILGRNLLIIEVTAKQSA